MRIGKIRVEKKTMMMRRVKRMRSRSSRTRVWG